MFLHLVAVRSVQKTEDSHINHLYINIEPTEPTEPTLFSLTCEKISLKVEVTLRVTPSSWQAVLVFSSAPPRTPRFAARMRKRQKTPEQYTAEFSINNLKIKGKTKTPVNMKT
ncbi:hypothetical protein [Serratia marcescens]|uniref:hypothetical protein n=1 Tax=Serratia marcescens TaxID=615 RepID=UPI0012B5D035|nr:hypothetical protein [Serratia marcescens]MBH3207117.1 hypothetical protein [Serratia marcescens]NCI52418.1 hypothetical protein [Serratia marcescens]NDJ04910.1 hypothetical protein [Serratia marcescens]NDJ28856.1 hypothetical protein [Serratia marcescens]NDJ42404.1 hypothetical protein [Serratia marcescens]